MNAHTHKEQVKMKVTKEREYFLSWIKSSHISFYHSWFKHFTFSRFLCHLFLGVVFSSYFVRVSHLPPPLLLFSNIFLFGFLGIASFLSLFCLNYDVLRTFLSFHFKTSIKSFFAWEFLTYPLTKRSHNLIFCVEKFPIQRHRPMTKRKKKKRIEEFREWQWHLFRRSSTTQSQKYSVRKLMLNVLQLRLPFLSHFFCYSYEHLGRQSVECYSEY